MFQDCIVSQLIQSGKDQSSRFERRHNSADSLGCLLIDKLCTLLFFSSRKLHRIQSELVNQSSVFYLPNLERCNHRANNIIGTDEFASHQFELNVLWHIIEGQPPTSQSISVELKNMKHFLENAGVDFNSSIQLMFDVITQMHEVFMFDKNVLCVLCLIIKL